MTRALLERCLEAVSDDAEYWELTEAIRAELAKTDTPPAWHDVPTEPGLWVLRTEETMRITDMDADAMFWRALDAGRWFGPISEDSGGKP